MLFMGATPCPASIRDQQTVSCSLHAIQDGQLQNGPQWGVAIRTVIGGLIESCVGYQAASADLHELLQAHFELMDIG